MIDPTNTASGDPDDGSAAAGENRTSATAASTGSDDAVAVIRFPATMAHPAKRRLADLPDRVVDGDPHHTSEMRHESADGAFQCGTWTSTPGRWRAFGDRDEFCTLLEGRAVLIATSGERQEFGPGDSFLIPNGFEGFWEVSETATKHFVILHHRDEA